MCESIENKVIKYIKDYDNFINKVAHSVARKCKKLEFEDIKQQVVLQLYLNCNNFVEDGNATTSTYFSKIILNAASNIVRKYWQAKNKINVECVSLDSYLEQTNLNATFSNVIHDDEESYFNPESYFKLNHVVGKIDEIKEGLSRFEVKVFDDFLNGLSIKKIAKKYKKAPKTIYNIVCKIREKVKKNLE